MRPLHTTAAVLVFVLLLTGFVREADAGSRRSRPLKTGQTTCWNTAGAVISCPGTGQDGELRRGEPRAYEDNGDGTIHDKDRTYTWTKAFEKIDDQTPRRNDVQLHRFLLLLVVVHLCGRSGLRVERRIFRGIHLHGRQDRPNSRPRGPRRLVSRLSTVVAGAPGAVSADSRHEGPITATTPSQPREVPKTTASAIRRVRSNVPPPTVSPELTRHGRPDPRRAMAHAALATKGGPGSLGRQWSPRTTLRSTSMIRTRDRSCPGPTSK